MTTIPLAPSSLAGSCDLPGSLGRTTLERLPIWSCSVRGLACHSPYSERGALLPHLFNLTSRPTVEGRYVFCATFLQVTLTGDYPAHCPTEFGLSSPHAHRGEHARRSSGCLRRNVKYHMGALPPNPPLCPRGAPQPHAGPRGATPCAAFSYRGASPPNPRSALPIVRRRARRVSRPRAKPATRRPPPQYRDRERGERPDLPATHVCAGTTRRSLARYCTDRASCRDYCAAYRSPRRSSRCSTPAPAAFLQGRPARWPP